MERPLLLYSTSSHRGFNIVNKDCLPRAQNSFITDPHPKLKRVGLGRVGIAVGERDGGAVGGKVGRYVGELEGV